VQLASGSADLLAVEPNGRLVVIEVKLANNAEARRAVVAQVLTYAAYLHGAPLHLVDGGQAGAAPPSRASDRQCQLAECHCHTPGDWLVDPEFVVSAS
jgi:hypothetical protein